MTMRMGSVLALPVVLVACGGGGGLSGAQLQYEEYRAIVNDLGGVTAQTDTLPTSSTDVVYEGTLLFSQDAITNQVYVGDLEATVNFDAETFDGTATDFYLARFSSGRPAEAGTRTAGTLSLASGAFDDSGSGNSFVISVTGDVGGNQIDASGDNTIDGVFGGAGAETVGGTGEVDVNAAGGGAFTGVIDFLGTQ